MDNPLAILRVLLLAVLLFPLGAAVVVAVAGRQGRDLARRVAVWCALLHLGTTAALTMLVVTHLGHRSYDFARSDGRAEDSFHPIAVPGDPGNSGALDSESYTTTWSLLSLAPDTPLSDVQFFVGLDGVNIWLVALASFMTLIAVLISWASVTEAAGGFYAWLFVLLTGVTGAFVAFDVILFYVFFELTLIPLFFLIGSWGVGGGRRDAARKFVLYTLFGSLLTLTGIVGVVLTNPTPVSRAGQPQLTVARNLSGEVALPRVGPVTFSLPRLMLNVNIWSFAYAVRAADADQRLQTASSQAANAQAKLDAAPEDGVARQAVDTTAERLASAREQAEAAHTARDHHFRVQMGLFVALMAGFAVKIPIVPFHTWLPAAYAEAPIGVTMLLSALLAKLGTFGVLRVALPLCPDAALEFGLPVFGVLGAIGIVYAAFCAYAQRDVKLLVAYSSVSHLGLLVIGLFAFNSEGLIGATLHMVNHGLSTGALFALLAFLIDRYRTLDASQYGGLMGRFPVYAVLFFTICLAGIGVPGLNNFVSEMLILAGVFEPLNAKVGGWWLGVAAASGIILSAWYVLTMVRRLMFGPLREPPTATGPVSNISTREVAAFGMPALLCLVLGVYPQPVIDTLRADVSVVARIGYHARLRADPSSFQNEEAPAPLADPQN